MPTDGDEYVRGPATYRKPPAFEFKAADAGGAGGRGGGYARVRSWEVDPDSRSGRKQMTPVAIHRLAAVAWCFPDDMTAADILASETLVGADVHHELGMPAANIESELSIREHGNHSSITQTEKRAWAADTKRTLSSSDEFGPRCGRCGEDLADGEGWTAEDLDGPHCMACIMELGPDGTVTPV